MSTIARGNAAEANVIAAFEDADLRVYVPFGGGAPADLLVALHDDRIVRVQVKASRIRNGCVRFNTCSTDHGRGRMSYVGRVDLLAVYSPDLQQVFAIPVESCPRFVCSLRLEPTANNQQVGVRFAADHTLERWLGSLP